MTKSVFQVGQTEFSIEKGDQNNLDIGVCMS